MTHEEKNIGGRVENPVSDEQKISNMLRSLERVEAPKDFDFRLKARIANARPEQYRKASLFPMLKYAAPLGLFLVVGAGIIAKSSYDNWQAPQVVEIPARPEVSSPVNSNTPAVSETPERAAVTPGQTAGPTKPANSEVAVQSRPSGTASRDLPSLSPGPPKVMTRDTTLRAAPTPIFAPGMGNSNSAVTNDPGDMAPKPEPVRDALQSIGIVAELDGKAWRVTRVAEGNIAHQLGMKAGDKIESIDGRAIDADTVFKGGSFRVKTIRVRRNGAAVDLEMPKPK